MSAPRQHYRIMRYGSPRASHIPPGANNDCASRRTKISQRHWVSEKILAYAAAQFLGQLIALTR